MSGAVLNICYGINLDVDCIYDEDVNRDDVYEQLQAAFGVESVYDAYGNHSYKLFIGLKIIECHEGNTLNLPRVAAALTEDQQQYDDEFKSLWNDMDDEVRELITKHFGDSPALFTLWSNT